MPIASHSYSSKSHYKIVLISVYMGKLPFWMPAFMLSCSLNPDMQWFIYTDIPEPPYCPNNVKFIPTDLFELNQRASKALGMKIEIQPDCTYKICDLKPAFGMIFKEDIQSFDFWGHGDLDVVWGDIFHFINTEILSTHDIITSRIQRISGHFCLFRNAPEVNSTYKWIPRITKMIQDRKHYAVDEGHITDYLYVHNNPNWVVKVKQALFGKQEIRPRVYWEKDLTTSGAHQRAMGHGIERCWWWKNGKTYNSDGREVMYLHFHNIKKTMKKINFTYGDQPHEFMITRQGIVGL